MTPSNDYSYSNPVKRGAIPSASSDINVSIPPEQRVYVNRNLRLSAIEAIGFDLDHTLAHYDQLTVGQIAFSATKDKLVSKKGYPREILSIPYDPDFLIRGLIVDLNRGNLLKMDCHNYVQRAFHGMKALTSSERKNIYASKRLSFSKSNYSSIDTLFHIPEVYLYVNLIDYLEGNKHVFDYRRLFFDVREMIDESHRDGTIKNHITRIPGRYIKADPAIFDVFERLRAFDKKLFLLTNSESEYTDALMTYTRSLARGETPWKKHFDIILTKANKPSFFSRRRSKSLHVDCAGSAAVRCRNAYDLEKFLGCNSDKIMYFGDHTYGDILRAKKTMGWRTGMIVPELEGEIVSALKIRKAYDQLVSLSAQREAAEREKASLERELQLEAARGEISHSRKAARAHSLDQLLQGLSEEIDNLESVCQDSYNTRWGSIFREGKQISRFGHQVRDFACIYMHTVSNCLHYPADHYFQTNLDFMPHEFFL